MAQDDVSLVLPSLGAMVPGWMLVVPRAHELNWQDCVTERQSLESSLVAASDRVEQLWGQPTWFEHGPAAAGSGTGCGVDHVHMHMVPLSWSLRLATEAMFSDLRFREVASPWWRARGEEAVDYLYLKEGHKHFVATGHAPRSQVFRRVIAHKAGFSKWNWRDDHRAPIYQATVAAWYA